MMAADLCKNELGRGFRNPVIDAQVSFRAILTAMAEPGTVRVLAADVEPPPCLGPATAIVLLALADKDTPLWLHPKLAEAASFLRFHTGAALAERPADACFGVVDSTGLPAMSAFHQGNDLYPDRSATVIVQCASLTGGEPVQLAGPGIRGRREVAPLGTGADFWSAVADNNARYPLGVDLILAAGRDIMCLPRSTSTAGPRGSSAKEIWDVCRRQGR